MGGGGSAPSTSTSTQVNYSPEETARRTKLMDQGQAIYEAQPATAPYPGAGPVPFSPETTAAQGALMNTAATGAGGIIPNAINATNFGLSNLIYGQDPTLDRAIGAAVRPIEQSYTDPAGYFAQNRADMIGSNMLGSSRDALANAVLGGRMGTAIGDTSAKLANQSRSDTLGTYAKVLGMTPDLAATSILPAQWASAVGSQKEGLSQAQADYTAQQNTWDLNYPWMRLQNLANIVYGGSSPGTTSTQTGGAPRSNPIGEIAGLASTAASIASLFMAFSDRRLKTNIVRLGETASGVGWYEYDLFGVRQQGVMADEVEAINPAAVTTHANGFKMVNYALV